MSHFVSPTSHVKEVLVPIQMQFTISVPAPDLSIKIGVMFFHSSKISNFIAFYNVLRLKLFTCKELHFPALGYILS